MNIKIKNDGYVFCKSNFYSAQDLLSPFEYHFTCGINKLEGEIDSGVWAVSYLLSMYKQSLDDFALFEDPTVTIDDVKMTLDEFSKYSCYMDTVYPLFSSKTPVSKIIEKAIDSNEFDCKVDDIRELFCIDNERFMRPLSGMGNERFKAMAAIGYVNEKQVYCFPWLSYRRYCYCHENLQGLIKTLADLDKVIILPVGRE